MIDEDVDAFVFCATSDEHSELSLLLDEVTRRQDRRTLFEREYCIREIVREGNIALVCTSSIGEIGRLPAAIAARDLLYHFRTVPRDIILCGISAAHPNSGYRLGDIVIPKQIIDYGEQKHSKGKIQIRALDYSLDGNRLHRLAISLLKNWHERIDEGLRRAIERNIKGLRWPPVCHTDLALACGDYVLDDKPTVQRILRDLSSTRRNKVWAVEMESTAIARALNSAVSEGSQLTVIKSVSDFAFDKTDSAQPGAQLIAATFVRELLHLVATQRARRKARGSKAGAQDIIAALRPNPEVVHMLSHYPHALAARWRTTSVDGAIEIFSCSQPGNKYGGYRKNQILCEASDIEWPADFGGIDDYQRQALEAGIIGTKDDSVKGWLKTARGTPNRIRILLEPPLPTVLDRGTLGLRFGNSDYFTVRTITELARRDFRGLPPSFDRMFPERWAEPEHRFSGRCVPYHVSAQGVLLVRPEQTPETRFLLLASLNTANPSITSGWGATMAEQMWAPSQRQHGDPWWDRSLVSRRLAFRAGETRSGDTHINETLARGLREEFQIDVDSDDCYQEPLLLNVAIEQDMYFITFIYFIELKLSLDEIYRRWRTAPDSQEMALLAAYQLTGRDRTGNELHGPRRLAELMACEECDPGAYLLPTALPNGQVQGKWHISSRLRMYACGMHLWPHEFERYVRTES